VADKRCDNGHFIDELWDLCPYCPQDQEDVPVVRPRASERSHHGRSAAAAREPVTRAVPSSQAVAAPPEPRREERTVAAGFDVLSPHRYVVGWLVGLDGVTRGESFPIRMGRNVMGRDRKSDIVVHDEQASSHHADLVFRPDERRFILMDHNSTNGTYVNESEIEPRRDLAGKDVIRIGAQRFLFMPLCHDGFHWDDEGLLR
jgi:hypothetical protein